MERATSSKARAFTTSAPTRRARGRRARCHRDERERLSVATPVAGDRRRDSRRCGGRQDRPRTRQHGLQRHAARLGAAGHRAGQRWSAPGQCAASHSARVPARRHGLDPATEAFRPGQATPSLGYGFQIWFYPGKQRRFVLLGSYGQSIFVDPARILSSCRRPRMRHRRRATIRWRMSAMRSGAV